MIKSTKIINDESKKESKVKIEKVLTPMLIQFSPHKLKPKEIINYQEKAIPPNPVLERWL